MSFTGSSQWTRYNGTGLVNDFTTGDKIAEISVTYDESLGKFRKWGSRVYYNYPADPLLLPGYSTTITGIRIGYSESTDGANFTFVGDCTPGKNYGRANVRKGPDNKWHMIANSVDVSPIFTRFDYLRSDTGMPGTWTLIKTGILPASTLEIGNAGDFVWNADGSVSLFYDIVTSGIWKIAYASGPDLEHLTRYNNGAAIISRSPNMVGDACIVKAGNVYVMVVHEGLNGNLPTQSSYYTNTAIRPTGWTRQGWLLTLTNFPNGPTSQAQIGDMFIGEKNGKTYLWWTEQSDQSGSASSLYFGEAEIAQSLEQLFDPAYVAITNPSLSAMSINNATDFVALTFSAQNLLAGETPVIQYSIGSGSWTNLSNVPNVSNGVWQVILNKASLPLDVVTLRAIVTRDNIVYPTTSTATATNVLDVPRIEKAGLTKLSGTWEEYLWLQEEVVLVSSESDASSVDAYYEPASAQTVDVECESDASVIDHTPQLVAIECESGISIEEIVYTPPDPQFVSVESECEASVGVVFSESVHDDVVSVEAVVEALIEEVRPIMIAVMEISPSGGLVGVSMQGTKIDMTMA